MKELTAACDGSSRGITTTGLRIPRDRPCRKGAVRSMTEPTASSIEQALESARRQRTAQRALLRGQIRAIDDEIRRAELELRMLLSRGGRSRPGPRRRSY